MFVGFFTKRSDELRLRKDDEFSSVKNVRRCHPATIMLIFMFIFREYHPEPGLFSHDWSRRTEHSQAIICRESAWGMLEGCCRLADSTLLFCVWCFVKFITLVKTIHIWALSLLPVCYYRVQYL